MGTGGGTGKWGAAAASTSSVILWGGTLSQGVAMEVSQPPPGLAADSTGLSQGVGAVSLHPGSPANTTVNLDTAALAHFISGEIMQHVELVQAARGASDDASTVAIHFPVDWAHLRALLGKLA